jgi:phosphate transport system protein
MPEPRLRVSLQEELDTLQATLFEEGEMVRRALRGALEALEQGDPALADEVIEFDDDVDAHYLAIEKGIETLLATQNPVAVDLRHVLAILHDNLHLERMADYCVTIAKLSKLGHATTPDPDLMPSFRDMAMRADEMIRAALDSLDRRDLARAESLVQLDALINKENRRIVQLLLTPAADPELQEWSMRLIVVSRCFERIGDHAVDIGEQTAYLVTGEFREFTDASR